MKVIFINGDPKSGKTTLACRLGSCAASRIHLDHVVAVCGFIYPFLMTERTQLLSIGTDFDEFTFRASAEIPCCNLVATYKKILDLRIKAGAILFADGLVIEGYQLDIIGAELEELHSEDDIVKLRTFRKGSQWLVEFEGDTYSFDDIKNIVHNL